MQHAMVVFTRQTLAACVTAVVIVTGAVVAMAQGGGATAEGSLGGVTAELRQLRLAVEEATRTQTQTHALAVYISAQQSRLVQVAGRLDAARKELDALTVQSQQLAAELSGNDDRAAHSEKPELKAEFEMQARALKHELARLGPQLQQAQNREGELSHMLQAEEARWTDLIAKLEQLVKK